MPSVLNTCPIKPSGRPVRETYLSAGFADAQEFGRGSVLIGREHHAEGRDDDVERAIGERQRLGVGLLEFDGQAFGRCARATALQQTRNIIRRNDVAPAMRGGQTDIPVAGGHVEELLSRPNVEGLAELLADNL